MKILIILFKPVHTLTNICVFVFVWAETVNTSAQLNKVNSSLSQLQSSVDLLQANVTAVKNRINQTLLNPKCDGCVALSPELQKLTLNISISVSTDFTGCSFSLWVDEISL